MIRLKTPYAVKRIGDSIAESLSRLKTRQIALEKQNEALRASQLALEEAHERYLDYYDFAPVGYLTLTDTGSISEVNLMGTMLLGVDRVSLLQRSFPAFLGANDREPWNRMFAVLLQHDERCVIELELGREDQFQTCVRADCQRLARPGKATMVRLALTDISERKRMEAELRRHRTQLESLVAQRTADLRAALGKAQLAAGAGGGLSRSVNDRLDRPKTVAGRMESASIEFNPRQMLRHAHDVMMPRAEAKGLRLTHETGDDVPKILIGDALRLEQVLLGLVGNVIEFTPVGEVGMRLGVIARNKNRVCITLNVEDTGIGMRPEDSAGLFHPCFQRDVSIHRKYSGSGLGLALCQRFAEMMDGKINVSGRESCGSIFSFEVWLDVGDAAAVAEDEVGAGHPPLASHYLNTHVLVVEDDAISAEIVGELLSSAGITVHPVRNGQEAIDTLAERGPAAFDMVLMDIQMPVMDGFSATRQIRTWAGFDRLPIVAMTAQALTHEKQIGAAAGMNDQLIKPFDPECLHRMLAKWIPATRKARSVSAAPPVCGQTAAGLRALRGVDIEGALSRFVGDEDRYRHWLTAFVEQGPATALQIREAVAGGQLEPAKSAVHAFKGRVGMLGLADLHAAVVALEAALIDLQPAESLLARMDQAIASTRDNIKTALGV